MDIHVLPETGDREERREGGYLRQREVGKEMESGKNEEERAEEFKMRREVEERTEGDGWEKGKEKFARAERGNGNGGPCSDAS